MVVFWCQHVDQIRLDADCAQAPANLTVYRRNPLATADILELGNNTDVVIATGSRWTRMLYSPLEIPLGVVDGSGVYTPDDIAAGRTGRRACCRL